MAIGLGIWESIFLIGILPMPGLQAAPLCLWLLFRSKQG